MVGDDDLVAECVLDRLAEILELRCLDLARLLLFVGLLELENFLRADVHELFPLEFLELRAALRRTHQWGRE